jgi:predicted methyltransferase
VAAKPPVVPKPIAAAVADPARPQADRDRDADRKPAECIAFAGLAPKQRIADLLPGGGYFTRIFSAVVGPKGQVFAVATPKRPDAPPDRPEPSAAVRAIAADPHYPNVNVSVEKLTEFKLPEKLDMVWTSQNYHDVHNVKDIDVGAFNKAVFESLKPGGIYIVIDHAAEKGAGFTRHVDLASERARRREGGSDGGGLRVRRLERRHRQSADDHNARVFEQGLHDKTDRYVLKFRKPK